MSMTNDNKITNQFSKSETLDKKSEGTGSVVDNLKYSELLQPYEETVCAHFSGHEAMVYRSVSMPAKKDDLTPSRLRKYDSITEAEAEYKMPDVSELEEGERLKVHDPRCGNENQRTYAFAA